MLKNYRSLLCEQTLAPEIANVGPWHARFQDHVRQLGRLDRLTLNLTILRRLNIRDRFATRYLSGNGIEIGAQNVPTKVDSTRASVEYVDALSNDELCSRYSLDPARLVPLAHVADAHDLSVYADAALDFLIANHVLEHFDDPIGGLVEWLRVLRPGGRLFITVPNYRSNAFDWTRQPEGRRHFESDHFDVPGRAQRNRRHYLDMAAGMLRKPDGDPEVVWLVDRWIDRGDRHHYHVWDEPALLDAVELAAEIAGAGLCLEGWLTARNGFELLVVLRKAEGARHSFSRPAAWSMALSNAAVVGRNLVAGAIEFYTGAGR